MIDASTRARRLEALRAQMQRTGIDLTVVAPSDSLRYLLGFAPKYDERACALLVTVTGAAMVMPNLNAEQSAAAAPELELVRWSDDAGPQDALRTALTSVDGAGALHLAADPEMRADHLMLLQAALPQAQTATATVAIGPLREAKDAGYGEYFVHRTGYGLGLSVHEPPWIMRGYDVELRPGVVHSVEPGIYLPGEFGVRLEEIVHVTETGCERFSSLPREVHVIAG